jgi:hypothetical protein
VEAWERVQGYTRRHAAIGPNRKLTLGLVVARIPKLGFPGALLRALEVMYPLETNRRSYN